MTFAACAYPAPTCDHGACTCNGANLCAGTCANLFTDAHNCGSCGSDCQGLTCVDQLCQAFVVTDKQPLQISYVAVDDFYVYWADWDGTSSGSVWRTTKTGHAANKMGSYSGTPGGLTVSGGDAILGLEGGPVNIVIKYPAAGGAPVPLATTTDSTSAAPILVSGANAYWLDGRSGRVQRAPTSGAGPVVTMSDSTTGGLVSITVDATNVYWTTYDDGILWKMGLTQAKPTAPTMLGSGLYKPWARSLTVDASNVYFTDWTSSGLIARIGKVPLAGGSASLVANPPIAEQGLVYANGSLYYPTTGVAKVGVGGGTITNVALDTSGPNALVVDSTSIFFAGGDANGPGVFSMPQF
jgi:hypothetical protein